MNTPRIFLSPPHMGAAEFEFVREAFATNWIAPIGPHVDAFEKEFARAVGAPYAVALSSGTAALHLALRLLKVGAGDEVFCSDLTFAASANPIVYEGATPVFIDSDRTSWNMDPIRLEEALADRASRGRLPKAVILVHLYGQCADIDAIAASCERYGVPLIEDAAEALGARYLGARSLGRAPLSVEGKQLSDVGERVSGTGYSLLGEEKRLSEAGKQLSDTSYSMSDKRARLSGTESSVSTDNSHPVTDNHHLVANHATPLRGVVPGTRGRLGFYSFNGNKIITTSGGGMLVSADKALIEQARFLSTQARDPAPHYEHSQIGFNYRMSNVLAGIGRGQLQVLESRVNARRANCEYYQKALADLPGVEFMPEPSFSRSTRWLTCVLIAPDEFGADRETVREALAAENIEARPIWKPMHLQPVFSQRACFGGDVSADLFARGLCLPSGSSLTPSDLGRVVEVVRRVQRPEKLKR